MSWVMFKSVSVRKQKTAVRIMGERGMGDVNLHSTVFLLGLDIEQENSGMGDVNLHSTVFLLDVQSEQISYKGHIRQAEAQVAMPTFISHPYGFTKAFDG